MDKHTNRDREAEDRPIQKQTSRQIKKKEENVVRNVSVN
jgi:hypothetical protein